MVVWRSQLTKPTNPKQSDKIFWQDQAGNCCKSPRIFHVKCATKDPKQFQWLSATQNQDIKIQDSVKILQFRWFL